MRRYGMMRRGGASRVIALLLAAALVAGFSATYLIAAGVPTWLVLLAVLVVLAVPLLALRSGRR
jgi:hypothetical protein